MEEEEGWLKQGHPPDSNILKNPWQIAYLKRDSAGTAVGFYIQWLNH
ncbi:hypothetical protein [Paenibacillus durus]|nr:hypothetical protein [Paenibacillus durus]